MPTVLRGERSRAMLGDVQPSPQRRDWTLPVGITAGVVTIVLLLCAGLVTAGFFLFRKENPAAQTTQAPSTVASPSPAPQPSPAASECLVGVWIETSYAANATIGGTTVRLKQYSGSVVHQFTADGKNNAKYTKAVRRGSANGDRYDVIQNGTFSLTYTTEGKDIFYSNPSAKGTSVWKINGKNYHSQAFDVTIDPETFKCDGDKLIIYGEKYSAEFKRAASPGVPV